MKNQALCDAAASGDTVEAERLVEHNADVNVIDKDGKTPFDLAKAAGQQQMRLFLQDHGGLTAQQKDKEDRLNARLNAIEKATLNQTKVENDNREKEAEVLSPELSAQVRESVQEMLNREFLQAGRMIGGLKDLKNGKFKDAANGIEPFLGVDKSWMKVKKCTEEGIIAEVKALCNCPGCAWEQARVLKAMERNKEAELTTRLAGDLEGLRKAQENDTEVELHLHKVEATRSELKSCGGWVYGSTESKAVDWPAEELTHEWGKYGQPLCNHCKNFCLDYSTIWADLAYILYDVTSELEFFNGVRDRGRGGMTLDDFMQLKQVLEANLSRAMVVALRFYTSHSFAAINKALRENFQPHPLPAIVMCINDGLRALRVLDAESDQATTNMEFYRGFTDTKVAEEFKTKGGTEFAPMSTTTDHSVACGYAVRKGTTDGALLIKIVTENNLQRGADLAFLSMFPGEAETLFPPLTFLQCTGKEQVMEFLLPDGGTFKLCIIEVKTTLP